MDQRERDALDHHRDVVGVAERTGTARRDGRQAGHDDHPGVPALTERGDAPPAERLGEHDDGSIDQASALGDVRAPDPGLDQSTDEQARVQHDHERVVPETRSRRRPAPCSTPRCAWRRPARRRRSRPTSPTMTVNATSVVTTAPGAEQDQLGAEAGTHRHQDAVAARRAAGARGRCPRGRAAPTRTTGCRCSRATRG